MEHQQDEAHNASVAMEKVLNAVAESKRGPLPCDLPHPTITKEQLYAVLQKCLLPYSVELYDHNDMDQDTGVISIRYHGGSVEIWEPDEECDFWVITYNDHYREEASWGFIPEHDMGVFRALAHAFCMDIQPLGDCDGSSQYRLSLNNPNS